MAAANFSLFTIHFSFNFVTFTLGEGTSVRKNPNIFGFSLGLHYLCTHDLP